MKQENAAAYLSGYRNPYLPLSIYIPDGEPKLFDGRVYLYGSKDYFGGEYCCHKYHAYSAPVENLAEWTDHGPILASTNEYLAEGIADGVDWSDGLLWAPNVVKRGEKYYLYFCLSDGSEGVAESDVPHGPFGNARRIMLDGKPIRGIDPSVLQDGDDYYYTWGQGRCHMAKLLDDMCTLDPATYVDALISNAEEKQGFHEGSSLRKIGDWYTIVYASEYTMRYPNHGAAPTCLDYAISKCLTGPYERRGTIIDNTGVDPQSWNNHGSILKIGDQWYVFYHGSSNNSKYTRRARVERIEVDEENGYIRLAEMTSCGFAESLNPEEPLPAAYGYRVWGGAYFTEKEEHFPLANIRNESAVAYRYFDFGECGDWQLTLNCNVYAEGEIIVFVNDEEKGCITVTAGTGGDLSLPLKKLAGRAEIRLCFAASHDLEILELKKICFKCI